MQLPGKVAVITGGRGIGHGIVNRFLEGCANVAIVQRSPIDEELSANPNVKHFSADLQDVSSLQSVIDDAAEYFGRIDILVNNAGIMFGSSVSEITSEKWDLMMDINLKAPLFLTQAVLPYLRESGGGSIINIGSIEGIGANPEHTAYSASKGGVHGMTKALAVDLRADNIRCNAIAPGWIATDLSENYLDGMQDPAAARSSLNNLHPVGHVGAPTDIGDVAVFLASDNSRFISGEVLVVDGGRTAKLSAP